MTDQTTGNIPVPRYALIFRTHFWDDFADRQFSRVKAQAPAADIYVLVDETRGHVADIPATRVHRLTDADILKAGYVAAGEGSIQWYSGDVPLYMFHAAHPHYDYYVQMEYDVNFHLNLDAMMAQIARDGADMVALTKGESNDAWPWLESCLDVYRPEEVRHQLICIGVFSAKALDALAASRLAQAQLFKNGQIRAWPYCEGYLPTEAARQGLTTRELSDYGSVDGYDWWPPYIESDLPRLQAFPFVHPVLDEKRYVPSLFKRPMGLKTLLFPTSWFGRKLRRLGVSGYVRAIRGKDFRQALGQSFRNSRLGALSGAPDRSGRLHG